MATEIIQLLVILVIEQVVYLVEVYLGQFQNPEVIVYENQKILLAHTIQNAQVHQQKI
jgi:hypothetical protein